MTVRNIYFASMVAGALFVTGCTNTAAGARQDAADAANKATAVANDAASKASAAANDAASKASAVANDATKATKDAAASTTATVAAAVETVDVKAALIADRTVDASAINVDTFGETKTVVLKGSVPTAEQKEEAGRIAAAEAPGYRIDNRLAIVRP